MNTLFSIDKGEQSNILQCVNGSTNLYIHTEEYYTAIKKKQATHAVQLEWISGALFCLGKEPMSVAYIHYDCLYLTVLNGRAIERENQRVVAKVKVACAYMLSCFNCIQLFVILWIVAYQLPLSQGFSRKEYWSELPCPPPGDLPDPGVDPVSLMPLALAGGFFTTGATCEARRYKLVRAKVNSVLCLQLLVSLRLFQN